MARFSTHSQLDRVVCASPPPALPFPALAPPSAPFLFPGHFPPSKQAADFTVAENPRPRRPENDGIAAFRLWKQRAPSRSIDHSAKREKRADRIARPRDRANATRHAISPLPDRQSVPNREFAMLPPYRAHGRSPPIR